MKRIKIELWSLAVAAVGLAMMAGHPPVEEPNDSRLLSSTEAIAESTLYLDATAQEARHHRAPGQWMVTDGESTAWIDDRTGQLVEIELAPRH